MMSDFSSVFEMSKDKPKTHSDSNPPFNYPMGEFPPGSLQFDSQYDSYNGTHASTIWDQPLVFGNDSGSVPVSINQRNSKEEDHYALSMFTFANKIDNSSSFDNKRDTIPPELTNYFSSNVGLGQNIPGSCFDGQTIKNSIESYGRSANEVGSLPNSYNDQGNFATLGKYFSGSGFQDQSSMPLQAPALVFENSHPELSLKYSQLNDQDKDIDSANDGKLTIIEEEGSGLDNSALNDDSTEIHFPTDKAGCKLSTQEGVIQQRIARRRERNREAARRSRERRTVFVSSLRRLCDGLERENIMLKSMISSLEQEIQMLKRPNSSGSSSNVIGNPSESIVSQRYNNQPMNSAPSNNIHNHLKSQFTNNHHNHSHNQGQVSGSNQNQNSIQLHPPRQSIFVPFNMMNQNGMFQNQDPNNAPPSSGSIYKQI